MKPKTRLQVEVWNLHQKLSEPKEHEPFMISKHDFYYTTHYKNLVCLECNHMWKPDGQLWHEELVGTKCPSCQKKLKYIKIENGQRGVRILTFSESLKVDRFQVHRYFSCWKHMSKKKLPEYSYKSLFEEWKDWDKDKRVIVGRTISYSTDGFSTSDYEIRNIMQSGWRAPTYDNVASDFNLPKPQFLPRFHKYGLKEDFHNCDYRFLLKLLELSPKIETLLKNRQKELLFTAVHKKSEHNRYWPQIKIMIRHKYKIKDAGLWYDYLDLLSFFGKDLHSPKYICPANLKKEHDRYVAKKRLVEKRQKLEAQKKKMVADQKNYEKEKSIYFGLVFQENKIRIEVIDSVAKVLEYGDKFKHCIYTNSYYNKKDSLLLVAFADQEPVETIELSLTNFKVLQSRGLQNEASKFNPQILELISKNTGKIKNIKPLKTKKSKSNNLIQAYENHN